MDKLRNFSMFPKETGFFPYIWLVYLAFPIYGLFFASPTGIVAGAGLLMLFMICYRQNAWNGKYTFYYILFQIAILTVLTGFFDPLYFYMAFYLSQPMAMLRSRKQFYASLAAIVLLFAYVLIINRSSLNSPMLLSTIPPFLILMFLPLGIRTAGKSRRLKEQLHHAQEEIERLVKNEERQRIARDLHDTLGHTLSLITLKSELAAKLIGKDADKAKHEIEDIKNTSRAALKQLRSLVSDIRTVSTLRDELLHAGKLLEPAGIAFQVEGDCEKTGIPSLAENILGLCLREAVTNIVKHSGARSCRVVYREEASEITLRVIDDGVGMAGSQNRETDSGHGLLGIKERLELIEGKLRFVSGKTSGTELRIAIPRIIKERTNGGIAT